MWATVDDVALTYGEAIPSDRLDAVGFLLDTAQGILLDLDRALPVKVEQGRVSRTTVRYVLCNMVANVLRNPEGIRQESDGDYSHTFDASVAAGRLRLNRDDKALLRGAPRMASLSLNDHGLRRMARDEP
ncbi:hypothetical protein [Actinomycetospora sp. CA-053990]|uniref:hypothetical protein n=1 Tax=Actinomycetospora sp. CA-053990 TaxID=3239891 RepID=UPI003D9052E0